MATRYERMFSELTRRGEGAFVPFVVVGDPEPELSLEVIRTLVRAGADALEVGIAFSDPIADGPTIQKADMRALRSGVRPRHAFEILRSVRQEHPALPIGLLVYANLIEGAGRERFYARAADAQLDSVLAADVPVIEAEPFVRLAEHHGIAPVLIATANSSEQHLRAIAGLSSGYTYVVTRAGVTGAETEAETEHRELLERLADYGAPPSLLGFGISNPRHVRRALKVGAAGAISGSAVVNQIERHVGNRSRMLEALSELVARMKAATRG